MKIRNWIALSFALLPITAVQAQPLSGVEQRYFDPIVSPRDDFYHAVNGQWIKDTTIPPDETSIGTFKALQEQSLTHVHDIIQALAKQPSLSIEDQKIVALYQSYMDEKARNAERLQSIKPLLVGIEQLQNREELIALMGKWQNTAISLPIAFYVSTDAKAANHYLAGLYQNGLLLPDRDYYLKPDPRFANAQQAYKTYISRLFTLAGYNNPQARAEQVFMLEQSLAKIQWSNVTNRDTQKTYNKLTISQLDNLACAEDWKHFFQQAKVPDLKEININQPDYVKNMMRLLPPEGESLSAWQNYLIAHTLDAYAPYLDHAMEQANFDFYGKALSGQQQPQPRWKRAVQLLNGSLGEAVGKHYVEAYFPPENKARIEALVQQIMQAYHDSLTNLSWMSDKTKQAAQNKLSKYRLKLAYPTKWRDYSTLAIHANDLVGNIERIWGFDYQRQLNRLGTPVDKEEWAMTPQTVNAYYSPTQNEIVFPAAILQPPFFNVKADDAVNYGAIGAVIGHEISHGFDDQGSHFDGDGNLKDWWTKTDRKRFHALTQKLVTQYSAYQPLPGKCINGELTLGENIADNAGLEIAYKAYQQSLNNKPAAVIDGMTGDQRFFYGFAQVWRSKIRDEALLNRLVTDPHSPAPYRVIGTLSNSDAFYRVFHVQPGDKMFKPPSDRVRIW